MSSEVGGASTLTGHGDLPAGQAGLPAGQAGAVEYFRRAIANDRLAHAYLLVGPAGVGKGAFARALTRHLFCVARREGTLAGDTFGGCGTCRNCLRVEHGNLPDLHWFTRPGDKRDIPIELVRQLQDELSLKPFEGPWKVFVIDEADRLNASSANCLLKVLEEPPAHSLILLLAEEQENFLATILSRVHVIQIKGLSMDDLTDLLRRQFGVDADQARFLSRVSGGSPGQARRLKEEGFWELHEWLRRRVRQMKPEENFDLAAELRKRMDKHVSSVQEERELLHRHLDGLMLNFRDELEKVCAAEGACQRSERLQKVITALLEAAETVSLNGNIRLTLENLFFEVAGASADGL